MELLKAIINLNLLTGKLGICTCGLDLRIGLWAEEAREEAFAHAGAEQHSGGRVQFSLWPIHGQQRFQRLAVGFDQQVFLISQNM